MIFLNVCGKFDSRFDKDVKILWDELLDKGKSRLKWRGSNVIGTDIRLRQNYFNTLKQIVINFILENQCSNEVFAEELIKEEVQLMILLLKNYYLIGIRI